MRTLLPALVACAALAACDAPPSSTAPSATAAPKPAVTIAANATPSVPTPATASATPPAASASAPPTASAAAASPCPEGARKNDEARYCITLPAKKLAVSYEGDSPAKGIREELEVSGDRLVITVDPAPAGKSVAQLKDAADKRLGASRVDGGDLASGYWSDSKDASGKHVVEGVVVSKYLITCTHEVRDEKNLEAARAVCKSLKTF